MAISLANFVNASPRPPPHREHARFTFEWASKSKSAVAAFLTASPAAAGTCRMRNQRDSRMFLVCDRSKCNGNKRSRLKSRSLLNIIEEKVDESGQSLLSLDCSTPPISRESVPL